MNLQSLLYFIPFCFFLSCKETPDHTPKVPTSLSQLDSSKILEPTFQKTALKKEVHYSTFLEKIAKERKKIAKEYTAASTNETRKKAIRKANSLFESSLENCFEYWYGTPWDFNGYSDLPNEGEIACGYFVSTPLKHLGFNLNRFKVAQQAAKPIIQILTVNDQESKGFSNGKRGELIDYIQSNPDGIYIVGLDNHVGWIQKKGKDIDFIHSSYGGNCVCVIRENASSSPIFSNSNYYFLGRLSGNKDFLSKWLDQSFFPIP